VRLRFALALTASAAAAAALAPGAHAIVPAKTVRSADGQLTVAIPRGALARPTAIRVRSLPQAQWPAELGRAQVRAGARVYSLEPAGLRFSKPVTITRRVLNVDVSNGVPGVVLTSRDARGRWAPLTSPETRVRGTTLSVSATTRHFSVLVTINTGGVVDLSPDHVTDVVDGEGWTARLAVRNAALADADWLQRGAVDFDDDGPPSSSPAVEFFFCDEVGPGGFGAEVTLVADVTAAVRPLFGGIALLRLDVWVEGTATCTGIDVTLQLLTACVLVTHDPFGAFPSFLTYVMAFAVLGLPPNAVLELLVRGVNNDQAFMSPIAANGRVEARAGIGSFGSKELVRANVNGRDVTAQVQAKLGTPVVGSNEGRIAGTC
jgi:hypothetical protein